MLYHGTSEKYLENIQKHGLTISENIKNQKYYNHNNIDYNMHSDQSMKGIYLTTIKDIAESYAESSSEITKTAPIVLEIDIPLDDLIIDEDNVKFEPDLKSYLLESYISTDNDGFFQLKNMILDEDTREQILNELQYWFSTGYGLNENAISKEDIEKLTISYINRMAAYCCNFTMSLCYFTEQSKQDILDLFKEDVKAKDMRNKYEQIFMDTYNDYILKYSKQILTKRPKNALFRSLNDIKPQFINISHENSFKP